MLTFIAFITMALTGKLDPQSEAALAYGVCGFIELVIELGFIIRILGV